MNQSEDKSKKSFFYKVLVKASLPITLLLLACSAVGYFASQKLELKLSLTDLLPANHPSVVKFDKITEIVGGVGYLTVVLQSNDKQTHLKVLPTLVKELQASPLVRSAFFEREEYFFAGRMLYYVPVPELVKLDKTIRKNIRESRKKALDLGLWEDKANGTSKEIDPKIRDAAKKAGNVLPYLQSKDGKYVLLMIKPTFDSTDLAETKALVASVEKILKNTLPAEVTYQFAGRYYRKISDSAVVEQDIFVLGTVSLIMIALVLFIYVRSIAAVSVIVIPVLMGICCTLGLAYYVIGHINIVTGFLLGILMGLGTDYAIHLVFRLRMEKLEDNSKNSEPVWRALQHSGHAIFVGATAASLAFVLLCFSDFRAFSEFGFICGVGMGIVMMIILLTFSSLSRFFGLTKRNFGGTSLTPKFPLPLLDTKKKFRIGLAVSVVLCIVATRVSFEYDFSKMLEHSAEVQELSDLVDTIYERSVTPSVLSAPSREMAKEAEDFLTKNYVPGVIDVVRSGASIIPEDQVAKKAIIDKIKAQIDPLKDKWLEKQLDVPAAAIRRWAVAKPFAFDNLPIHLQDLFRGKSQSDFLMYIYPASNVKLNTAPGVHAFAGMIRDLEKHFPDLLSGSDAVVFADILDLIKRDGGIILAGILAMVALIIWLNLRDWESFVYSFFPLLLAFPIGMGLMAILGIKFNIFNIAIIPSFVAIGIDVPIHITHRAREVGSGFKAARDLASAVNLTLAATAIGFGVLIFARAGVLRSLGWLALLGTLSIWWVGMFLLPAVLEKKYQKKARKAGRSSLESDLKAAPDSTKKLGRADSAKNLHV